MSDIARDPATEAGVRALLREGRLDAAEQMCARLVKAGVSAPLAPALLMLAQACHAAGRHPSAVAWLKRLTHAAPNAQALEAAHLALELERPQVACLLFEKADKHRGLPARERLLMAQATLKASELLRQPYGRHGAWSQHEEHLRRATELFDGLTTAEALDAEQQAAAWTGYARALRLQRADARRIELALARAAALLAGLPASCVVVADS